MKRSQRIVALTSYFIQNPKKLMQLAYFSDTYGASKSSISEDITIINEMLKHEGIGYIERYAGVSGGVKFIPKIAENKGVQFIDQLCVKLEDPSRILPGGYLYMSDLLGDPSFIRQAGHLFASAFAKLNIDVVMTVATKGVPLAYAVASYLNVPVVIVRRNPKVTEGSSVSINYVSGSTQRIQTMVLPRRSLHDGANVCIIDDFMKAGGTINGMESLLAEFNAKVVAKGVLAEAAEEAERVVKDYLSLVKIKNVNIDNHSIDVHPGTIVTMTK